MAIEEDVRGAIKKALDAQPEGAEATLTAIWSSVISLAAKGSDKHQKIFLEYFHGKPKENEGQPSKMVITVVRK